VETASFKLSIRLWIDRSRLSSSTCPAYIYSMWVRCMYPCVRAAPSLPRIRWPVCRDRRCRLPPRPTVNDGSVSPGPEHSLPTSSAFADSGLPQTHSNMLVGWRAGASNDYAQNQHADIERTYFRDSMAVMHKDEPVTPERQGLLVPSERTPLIKRPSQYHCPTRNTPVLTLRKRRNMLPSLRSHQLQDWC
jgi:hypothetical protein